MQDLDQLAETLRQARVSKELSAAEAAAQSGVYIHLLTALEAGKITLPPPTVLLELAQFYGLDYLHLMQLAGHLKRDAPAVERAASEL